MQTIWFHLRSGVWEAKICSCDLRCYLWAVMLIGLYILIAHKVLFSFSSRFLAFGCFAMLARVLLIAIGIILCVHDVCLLSNPQVIVPSLGEIRGSSFSSAAGRSFIAFRGVPYAEPPIGQLRFKVPFIWKQNFAHRNNISRVVMWMCSFYRIPFPLNHGLEDYWMPVKKDLSAFFTIRTWKLSEETRTVSSWTSTLMT